MTDSKPPEGDVHVEAPKDVASKDSTGTGVYDQTLGRFVGPVHRGTSAAGDAQAYIDAQDDGHSYVTRKV
jgi:hypothetical protein